MIRDYGGVANMMPWFAMFMVLFAHGQLGPAGHVAVSSASSW